MISCTNCKITWAHRTSVRNITDSVGTWLHSTVASAAQCKNTLRLSLSVGVKLSNSKLNDRHYFVRRGVGSHWYRYWWLLGASNTLTGVCKVMWCHLAII